ncbi:MAG: TIGR03016 family PEP-CTERM system-associated outer membrane protein [Methylobacter sp.]|nr:TIGR03016 family PEP-CTERM system-associated outer membrane protein [Methylobacter sp.]
MKAQIVSTTRNREALRLFKSSVLFIRVATVYIFFYNSQSFALNWTMTPTMQVQEIYSDNIRLSPKGAENSAFVTEVSPGVSIIGRSARSTLNLNYRMQNLYNAQGDKGLSTFNQLQYNSHNVLVQNKLFLDSRSSVSQQNLTNNQIANDNISGSGNSTNVTTFGISPYWTPHFGSYANGLFRLNFDTVTLGTNSSSDINTQSSLSPISDTATIGETVQLNNGTEFKRVSWNLSHNNTENYRKGGDDVKFQNSNATVRTYLNRYFNVFAQGGYSNNDFQTTTSSSKNGLFYTVGAQWIPSQHYSIAVGAGNNSYVTVSISPIQRISWITTYRDNQIGLNTGKTWQTSLNYRTRRSIWELTHDNDTTTTQEILSQLRIFRVQDQFGNIIINPVTGQPVQFALNLPTLTNEVIVRKRWNFSVSFNTGKSTISASAFNENRVFQVTGNNEKVSGLSATWNWQFASKTSAYISPTWQQTERAINSTKDERYDVAIGMNRSITSRINGRLEFRHLNQKSDLNTNDFQENRATANLFMRF